jgi:serine/threonine-protein kinase HipA
MDHYAVIWTQAAGAPQKLADMVLTPDELRVTKTPDAIAQGMPGLSLLHDKAGMAQAVYARSASHHLPSQLEALLPPRDHTNPQRRILAALLDRRLNTRGMQLIEQEWHMLMLAGRNGLGHLDVFRSDDHAREWYASGTDPHATGLAGSALWSAFRRFVQDTASASEEAAVIESVGPTPGVSGFVPKLLSYAVLEADGSWQGGTGSSGVPVIVKLECEAYPGLLALEELAYRYHRQAGFAVPRTWLQTVQHQGQAIPLLAIERFDRAAGAPIPLESAFSLLRTGNPRKFVANTDGDMETVARIFEVLECPVVDKVDYFRRFVMALLTGNGDLHTENISIVGGLGSQRLAPVYDPAPMRAYRGRLNHDLLSALPFAGIGGAGMGDEVLDYAASGRTPPDLRARLAAFGSAIGLPRKQVGQQVDDLLDVTTYFAEEAASVLAAVPDKRPRAPDVAGFLATLAALRTACKGGA